MSIENEYFNYVINVIENKKYDDYTDVESLVSRFLEYPFSNITEEQIYTLLSYVYKEISSEEKLIFIDTCLALDEIDDILLNNKKLVEDIINIYFECLSECTWYNKNIIEFIRNIMEFVSDYDYICKKIADNLSEESLISILLSISEIRNNPKFDKYLKTIEDYKKIRSRVLDIAPFLIIMNPDSEKYFNFSDIKISYLSSIEGIIIDNNWQMDYCMKNHVEEKIISQREANIMMEAWEKLKDNSITEEERMYYYKEMCNGSDPISLIFNIE